MGRKQYTEEQIAFALRQAESGTGVAGTGSTWDLVDVVGSL